MAQVQTAAISSTGEAYINALQQRVDKYLKTFNSSKSETVRRFSIYKAEKYYYMLNYFKNEI